MSHTKTTHITNDKSKLNSQEDTKDVDEGDKTNNISIENCAYTVTVSKKSSASSEDGASNLGQKSFISIHSTDRLCQLTDADSFCKLEDCNIEVLSRNDIFPSTSEESLSNVDNSPVRRKKCLKKPATVKLPTIAGKYSYVPTNSKSSTGSRQMETVEGQSGVYSDFDIPKNTLHVVGSNPGEPKMSYQDPPKKMSKTLKEKDFANDIQEYVRRILGNQSCFHHGCLANIFTTTHILISFKTATRKKRYKVKVKRKNNQMKKFLRNIDKHKSEQNSKDHEKAISKLATMRGILKDGRSGAECTGDSSLRGEDGVDITDDITVPFQIDFDPRTHYSKQNIDKNVTFNTHVLIIHYTGDLCVGQSVEALSKEKDQQARNSELRKTFLTKYNEYWPTQK